jgi:Secretion system C-terminal sorting domain
MRNLLTTAAFLCVCTLVFPQIPPPIEWQRALGGSVDDLVYSLRETSDEGFVTVGQALSNNGNVSGNHGLRDVWVVKLGASGNVEWQKALGGTNHDAGLDIQQTNDQGYIVVGGTNSNNGDVSGNHGSSDWWVVKLDGSGNIQWQRCLGGTGQDGASAVVQAPDGGYLIAGETGSTDGDVTGNHGGYDVWLVKLDATGALLWQHTYGGTGTEFAHALCAAGDGGFVLAGASDSNDGDVSGNHSGPGSNDYWVLKVDSVGQLLWQNALGGTDFDRAENVVRTSANGGFVVTGRSSSTDGDVTGAHGDYDCWVVGLDSNGLLQWEKALGGSAGDGGNSIIEVANSDLVVAANNNSTDGDVSMGLGGGDAWILRLSASGTLLWEMSLGGTGAESASDIVLTTDGGYAFAGICNTNNGDVSGVHGGIDHWVVKLALDPTGVSDPYALRTAFHLWPNPTSNVVNVQFASPTPGLVRFAIYSTSGQLVRAWEQTLTGLERSVALPTADLVPGAYRVQLSTATGSATQGFVKW